MSALTNLTIAAARDGLRKKPFSALELTDAYLAAMEKARVLNAYIVETPDKARAMAKASDARLAQGRGRRAGRHSRSASRISSPPRVSTPRPAAMC